MTPEELHRRRRAHLRALKAEVRRLTLALKRLGAEKVWLIGSLADGTANLYSDADMVAVMRSKKPFVDRLATIYGRLGPRNVDLLVYTPDEYDVMLSRPFLRNALRKGVLLHEKHS